MVEEQPKFTVSIPFTVTKYISANVHLFEIQFLKNPDNTWLKLSLV